MAKILVIDDDPSLNRALRLGLQAGGHDVTTAATGEHGISQTALLSPDVVVLDMGLPDMDGIAVCRTIRGWSDVPIIILSATGAENRKVAALDAGANDYVTKPFSTPELLARIRALMRRNAGENAVERLELRGLEVDFQSREARVRGEKVHLTPKEFELLQYLANHPDRIVPHRELLVAVWGPDYGEERGYLRAVVKQVRKKIEPNRATPQYLLTHTWVGYQLRVPK
jgi:two-component system KDP operon response regulator KdpE